MNIGMSGLVLMENAGPSKYFARLSDEELGDLAGRMRFSVEVIETVSETVSDDFIVGFRMTGDPLTDAVGLGVHRQDAAGKTVLLQVGHRAAGGFAGVGRGADDGDELPGIDREVDAVQDLRRAVGGVQHLFGAALGVQARRRQDRQVAARGVGRSRYGRTTGQERGDQ